MKRIDHNSVELLPAEADCYMRFQAALDRGLTIDQAIEATRFANMSRDFEAWLRS